MFLFAIQETTLKSIKIKSFHFEMIEQLVE